MVLSLPISHKDLGAGGKLHLVSHDTLIAAASSITLGLPSMYRMFILDMYLIKDGSASDAYLRINGDTGSNYAWQRLTAQDSTINGGRAATSYQSISNTVIAANQELASEIIITKSVAGQEAQMLISSTIEIAAGVSLEMYSGEWGNTADLLSSLLIVTSSGNFDVGSSFTLYGVTL